jgi:hypothetical protein
MMAAALTVEIPIRVDVEGVIWQATVDYLEHHAQPSKDPRWFGAFAAIDWSRVPDAPRADPCELSAGAKALLDYLIDAELAEWQSGRS